MCLADESSIVRVGTIPESICDLEELQEVDFRMNSIKGTLYWCHDIFALVN